MKLLVAFVPTRSVAVCGLAVCFCLSSAGVVAALEPSVGELRGTVLEAGTGKPLPNVQIVVRGVDEKGALATASDQAGKFEIAQVPTGHYQVAASTNGFHDYATALDISADQAQVVELRLNAVAGAGALNAEEVTKELQAMRGRIEQLEAQLKEQGTTPAVAAPVAVNLPPVQSNSVVPSATPAAAAPAATAVDLQTPFADYDWTWLNGNSRQKDFPLDSKYFSGEFRADTFYGLDFNQPRDHSMGGSSEVFRSGEVQLEDLSIGGDFHAGNMRGRVLALFGMFSTTTPRNDASAAVGQWDVRTAYRYISEAYGGYHFNVQHGINVDAGIFVSYVGLFSYHNFDNWAYQPSYVSSNTPWFFNGVRVQWFPTNHLKIEPWFINGWQSYNKFNGHPGLGGQIRWTPKPWLNVIGNQYGVGNDNVGLPHRGRYHTDDSIELKYFDRPQNGLDKMAFTLTGDMGCETGQGVTCYGGKGGPKQSFLGYMAYNRFWFNRDRFAITLGGGQINNPGRYLALVLPINGADAISGTPYFPSYPGAPFKAWDATSTFDYMPSQFTTFRLEFGYRHTNVPYWSGRGGITPPGGNNGSPGLFVCNNGAASLDGSNCGDAGLWKPDLRKGQALLSFSVMVKL